MSNMIERVARSIKQRNRYVVEQIGSDGLARQLSIADTSLPQWSILIINHSSSINESSNR